MFLYRCVMTLGVLTPHIVEHTYSYVWDEKTGQMATSTSFNYSWDLPQVLVDQYLDKDLFEIIDWLVDDISKLEGMRNVKVDYDFDDVDFPFFLVEFDYLTDEEIDEDDYFDYFCELFESNYVFYGVGPVHEDNIGDEIDGDDWYYWRWDVDPYHPSIDYSGDFELVERYDD